MVHRGTAVVAHESCTGGRIVRIARFGGVARHLRLRSPVRGQTVLPYPACTIRSGTALSGFWECAKDLSAQAAPGTCGWIS